MKRWTTTWVGALSAAAAACPAWADMQATSPVIMFPNNTPNPVTTRFVFQVTVPDMNNARVGFAFNVTIPPNSQRDVIFEVVGDWDNFGDPTKDTFKTKMRDASNASAGPQGWQPPELEELFNLPPLPPPDLLPLEPFPIGQFEFEGDFPPVPPFIFLPDVPTFFVPDESGFGFVPEMRLPLPPPPILVGDLNGDGFVGAGDLDILLGQWNQTVPPFAVPDLTGDGFIGAGDLDVLLGNWNAGVPLAEGAAVPEPGAAVVLGLGGLAALGRRRRRGTR